MAYSENTLERAKRILKDREEKAQLEQISHQQTAFGKCPELLEIKNEMAKTGLSIVKVMLEGGDAAKRLSEIEKENKSLQQKRRELLVKNGFPEDYLAAKYSCEKCEDTGYVDGRMCSCLKNLLTTLAFEDLAETTAAKECRFDNFDLSYYSDTEVADSAAGESVRRKMEAVLEYCRGYAEDFGKGSESLFMFGATGLGKTHLSLAIAGEVVKKGYSVYYGSAPNILSKLENEKFGRSSEYGTEETLENADLLVIDDLGAEFSTQFTVSAIYNIINMRIAENKPVIISTNLTMSELQSKYSERITSRIIGCYTCLRFFGRDVRQIKQFLE